MGTLLLFSADVAGTDVGTVAHHAFVVETGAEGEAPHVHLHAVPVGRHIGTDATLAALDGGRQHAALGIGTVDEEKHLVVEARLGALLVRGEGDIDLLGSVELRGAEAHTRQGTVGDDEVGIVDSHRVDGVGVYRLPVLLHEDVALRGAALGGVVAKADVGGRHEGRRQVGEGGETSTDEHLGSVLAVTDAADVSTHHGDALPERTNDGAHLAKETIQNSTIDCCHNFKCFKG